MNGDIWSTFFLLLIMAAVLAGAYFTTKFISKKSMRITKNKYINVCDRMVLSKDKQIVLIEVGGEYFLIGCSGQSINLISTFDSDAIKEMQASKKEPGKKGVFKGVVDFVANARKAQTDLYNARTGARRQKKQPDSPEDVLEKIMNSAQTKNQSIRDKRDSEANQDSKSSEKTL